jgi:hypothetical protein
MEATTNSNLQSYYNYFAMLELFQMACKDACHTENPQTFELKEVPFTITPPILGFINNTKLYVLELKANAIREIKILLLEPNNNAERLIEAIHFDCDKISKGFDWINGKVRALYAEDLSGVQLQKHIKNFSDNERTFYYGYAPLVEAFYDFYSSFLRISRTETKPAALDSDISGMETVNIPDHIKEAIEKYLNPLKDVFRAEADYNTACKTVSNYFLLQQTTISSNIFVKPRNIKKLAKALGSIHRDTNGGFIPIAYLEFSKNLFSCFSDQKIEKDNMTRSTFHKYFTGNLVHQ